MKVLEAGKDALRSPIFGMSALITGAAALHLSATAVLLHREAELRAKVAVDSQVRQITALDKIAPAVAALSSMRLAAEAEPRSVYYLAVDPDGRRMDGNLGRWPSERPDASGWRHLGRAETGGPNAVGRTVMLDAYYRLLIVRSVDELGGPMNRSVALFGLLALSSVVLALGVAGAAASRTRRRIDRISGALRAYERRELQVRIPSEDRKDALGALAGDVNLAMDQIEGLVTGYRTLADQVAHELKRPLALARLAVDRHDGGPDALREVRGLLDQALETFEAVITLNELKAGLEQSRTMLDLAELTREAEELYAPVAEIKGVRIQSDLEPATIRGSEAELRRLLANLLDNAVKYTRSNTVVTLSTARHPHAVVFRIADEGPGLAGFPKATGKPFERGPAALETEGLGLGLSIVRIIAARHGASLHFTNVATRGAAVEVAFPDINS